MRVFSLSKEFEIYNELLKNRIVFLSGNIDEKSAKEIVAKLLYLDSKSHDDIILMNTNLDQGMVINLERDFWLSSDIALNYGIVDRIIEPIGV